MKKYSFEKSAKLFISHKLINNYYNIMEQPANTQRQPVFFVLFLGLSLADLRYWICDDASIDDQKETSIGIAVIDIITLSLKCFKRY